MAEEPSLRPMWSGTITFGLVNVPVDLYPAVRHHGIPMRMLAEDGTPLNRRYYCPADGKEIEGDEIIRGYEIEKGKFILVDDEELQALEPEKSRDIDLRRFVDVTQIAPYFFDRPYFLAPSGKSNKAYRLLADVMEKEEKAGVATFVMRDKEYFVAILAENGILRAETLRFADEIRSPEEVGLPERKPARAKQVTSIEKAIAKASAKSVPEEELKDEYVEQLRNLIEKKSKQKKAVVHAQPSPEADEDFVDLMAVLKRSISKAA